MCNEIKRIVIFVIVIMAINCNLVMSRQRQLRQLTGEITLDVLPKVTKGFPVVVKVNVEGPQEVFYTSIFYGDLNIKVHLTSRSNGKEYIITSRIMRTGVGRSPSGGLIDITDQAFPPLTVPKGQKYTMLFDLCSLAPRLLTETFLEDIPSGQYSMFVEFYRENIKSTPIDIELIEPTEQERHFIQKTRELEKGQVKLKGGVSWSKVLSYRTMIPNDGFSSLTKVSKDQISFHKLLADVEISDEKAKIKAITDVNDAKLPKFFEPERQLLLFELKGNPAEERDNLIKKYPQLQLMVEKLKPGDKVLLGHHNKTVIKDDPNKPAEPPKLNRQNRTNRNDINN
jgi:hypothetical protein